MKVNRNRLLILLLLFWNGLSLMGQITPGQLDNYSGSSATWLNPSNLRTTFVYMDFGFANIDVSFRNDFAYLPRTTVLPSLRSAFNSGVWPTLVEDSLTRIITTNTSIQTSRRKKTSTSMSRSTCHFPL